MIRSPAFLVLFAAFAATVALMAYFVVEGWRDANTRLPYAVAIGDEANITVRTPESPSNAVSAPADFRPPAETDIPANEFGDMVRRGHEIFVDTTRVVPQFTGNRLQCASCHLDAGRAANAAPLWAAYGLYPAFRKKNGQINTFEERLRECFRYSMNGVMPPAGDATLVALESYAYWMAKGVPLGVRLKGQGFPQLARPPLAPAYVRGKAVYAQHCAACHGATGAGSMAGPGSPPPLWGAQSYNWGAGMQSVSIAAGFIKANMPLGQGYSLSDQDAWDVALFINSHERPQDPRYTGSVAGTRARFHAGDDSMYGQTVDGVVLGTASPPSGESRPK